MSRTERDAFGLVELPNDALYGVQTARTVQNMSFSGRKLADYPDYVVALAWVKTAAARANARAGALSPELADAIEAACARIASGELREQFVVDAYHGGGGIGANMNANEVIANAANERLGGERGAYAPVDPIEHANASQSTSDVCHTAVRLAALRRYDALAPALDRLGEALAAKAAEFAGVATISRTCLQDAMRTTLGDLFAGYAAGWRRRTDALRRSVESLAAVNLGGTVIGSGVGAPAAYRSAVVDCLRDVAPYPVRLRDNLYDAAQNLDDLAAVSAELALSCRLLLKIAKDLRLLSSGPEAGFGELKLPAVQAGSSFFPGKINPVVPETLMQCCFLALGADRTIQLALEHAELNLTLFDSFAGVQLLEAMTMLERAVASFADKCVAGVAADEARCRELTRTLIPVVADLKETYGYAQVSRWMKEEPKERIISRWIERSESEHGAEDGSA